MEMTLNRLLPGLSGTVTQILGSEMMQCRLRSFGLIPGTLVSVCYRSPGGGVTALALRDTMIAMRTCELKKIRVRLS